MGLKESEVNKIKVYGEILPLHELILRERLFEL